MDKWTTTSPSENGYYWWREGPGVRPGIVYVDRSGHKPWWNSWGMCHGCHCEGDVADIMPLNLCFDGSGPIEDGYGEGEEFRDGEWWPVKIVSPTNKQPDRAEGPGSRIHKAFAGPVPANLGECFDMLKEMALAEDLEAFRSYPVHHYHHSLGRHIRNEWGLWGDLRMDDESGIKQKTLLCVYMEDLGLSHADDMSGLILKSFRRHLRGIPLDVKGQVKKYQQYWKDKK